MALALGEDRDEHVGARHFLAARRLHVDHRALDDALEAGRRLGVLAAVRDEVLELGVDVLDEVAAQHVEIDIAGAHHGGGVLVLDQRQQEMLERRVFVATLVGGGESAVEGLFEAAGEGWHDQFLAFPEIHFFSITHCSGCWCLRAKSITCVTFVSATS